MFSAIIGLTALAVNYQDGFWLWLNRVFELAFILYTIAVIYGIYTYLPAFAAALTGGFVSTLNQIFTSKRMGELGEKGVQARQFLGTVGNPAKGGIVKALLGEFAGSFVSERWGKKAAERVTWEIENIPVDLDPIIWDNLPVIAERLGGLAGKAAEAKGLAEQLRMLGKISPVDK